VKVIHEMRGTGFSRLQQAAGAPFEAARAPVPLGSTASSARRSREVGAQARSGDQRARSVISA